MSEVFSNGQLFISLLTLLGGGLIALGAALRWGLRYVDTRVKTHSDAERKAREDLRKSLEARIAELDAQVKQLTRREAIYLHRIYQLEAVVLAAGIELPFLDGWPVDQVPR